MIAPSLRNFTEMQSLSGGMVIVLIKSLGIGTALALSPGAVMFCCRGSDPACGIHPIRDAPLGLRARRELIGSSADAASLRPLPLAVFQYFYAAPSSSFGYRIAPIRSVREKLGRIR